MARTIAPITIPLITLLLVIAILAASCKKSAPNQMVPPSAPEVIVVRPLAKEIVEHDEYTGRLAASESVEIRARVSGYLDSVNFEDGQTVEKGDLLFVVDPRPLEADLARAEAALRQAEAQTVLSSRNFVRSRQLRNSGAIAQQEYETAVNAIKESEANQQAAQAAVTAARLTLGFSDIKSPTSGRVGRKNVSVGNLITGGAANSTLLTTVVSYDPIECYFDVDERSFLKYQKANGERKTVGELVQSQEHAQVEMALVDEEGFPHKGRLNFVDNRLNTETSTIELRATFPNPDLALTPGLFARIRIPASERYRAILIPDQAVQTDQAQTFVYVIGPEQKALYRKVTLGPVVGNLRVVREGLKAEDRVIVSGMQAARPGTVVHPEEKPINEIVPNANLTETPIPPPKPSSRKQTEKKEEPDGPRAQKRTTKPKPEATPPKAQVRKRPETKASRSRGTEGEENMKWDPEEMK